MLYAPDKVNGSATYAFTKQKLPMVCLLYFRESWPLAYLMFTYESMISYSANNLMA